MALPSKVSQTLSPIESHAPVSCLKLSSNGALLDLSGAAVGMLGVPPLTQQ